MVFNPSETSSEMKKNPSYFITFSFAIAANIFLFLFPLFAYDSTEAAFPVQLQAQHMFQEITTKITEADASISINENRWIQIDKASGIDTVVLCQAYIPAEELKNKLQVLQISPAAINNIQTAASAQDGIYLFLLDEGKIVAKGTLGAEVSLAEPVLGVKLQDSLSIEIIRLDQKWRPLQIRKIK